MARLDRAIHAFLALLTVMPALAGIHDFLSVN
jgi:hypothetical protein